MVVCTLMGFWQLGVYGDKHAATAAKAAARQPIALSTAWGPDDAFSDDLSERPVVVTGRFTGDQIRIARGHGRYWIVAPLRVAGTRSSLIVVRGWSGRDSPPVPGGSITFRARLQPGEQSTADVDPTTGILPALSIPALANVLPGDLYSGYAVTDDARVTDGLKPVAPPSPDVAWTVGLRNLAYAMQWWVFGAFSLFMWWRMAVDAVVGTDVGTAS